ncbi:MAG: hypothetical protein GVY30_06915 [Chloroflexi bacterium]|jgi:hypothetical protein|nr:hypothetical protein [Chloroflexota bacterium]
MSKQKSGMGNSELANYSDPQRAIVGYNEDQIQQFAEIVKRVAPWANDKKNPMTNTEIGLAVRRAMSMNLDPLNPHEVQIWKDHRGNINLQLAYTLTIEWVKRFCGQHTEPRYYRLTESQLVQEGLDPNDVAYKVEFIMKDDLQTMREMLELGVFDPQEVKAMFTVTGIGTSNEQEYNNKYFAPNARSKSWKVKKRALIDAYRRKFGTPSRAEIEELRRSGTLEPTDVSDYQDERDTAILAGQDTRGRSKLFLDEGAASSADDWQEVADSNIDPQVSLEAKRKIAQNAKHRRENPIPSEEVEDVKDALYGGDVVEGEYEEVEAPPEHWSDDQENAQKFWDFAAKHGYKAAEVYEVLNVARISDYEGTARDACVALKENAPAASEQQPAAPAEEQAPDGRPYTPGQLRNAIAQWTKPDFAYEEGQRSKKQWSVNQNLREILGGDQQRKQLLWYLTGKESSGDLTDGEVEALRGWLDVHKDENGEWAPSEVAADEARSAWEAAVKELGQTEMFDGEDAPF